MRRLCLLVAVALAVTACSDSELTTGPEGLDPSANITSAGLPGATVSDICGTVTDPVNGLPGVQVASPCDGDSNLPSGPTDPNALDPAKLPYTGSTFWLSSIEKSPSPVPANFGGLAARLHVRAYPYPNEAACEAEALAQGLGGVDCTVRDLDPVTEVFDATTGASLRYETAWKSKKSKQGGPGAGDFVPDNTYWQIVAFLDFDGDGAEDTEDIASRIIKWTGTPSSDNPLDGWSLDINWGSNQPIPFVLEANESGCFGTASAEDLVQCLVNFDLGGVLTLLTDDGSVILTLGAGNTGIGLAIVTGSECESGSLGVDAPEAGSCSVWEVDPPLSSGTTLQDSYLCVAENSLPTDISNYVVYMSDEDGVLALTPDADGCPTGFASGDDLGTGFTYVWNRVKRLFGPAPLVAGHGSSGSRLTTIRSEFQLVKTAQMQAVGGIQSFTVPENSTTRLQAVVKDHENSPTFTPGLVSGAEIYVFGQSGGATVVCSDDPTTPAPTYLGSCATYAPAGGLPAWAGSAVVVTTGSDGIVEVDAMNGTTSAEVRMLGCAIAVPGSDTPASADPADSPGPCNRDPGEEDNGLFGFANGPLGPNIVDPFMSGGVADPVWANDLSLIYSLQVCAAPTVNGTKDANDPWSQGAPSECIPAGFSDSFETNVGGNLGGGGGNPVAQLEWFVGSDGPDRRIYFGLEIPLASDPTGKKVSVAVTFDRGDGSSSGVASEFDDQIVLDLDKFSAFPTGDVTDRYLKSSCTTGTSVCNSDDTDLSGDNDAEGAMAWDATSGTLFIELSQKLTGGDATVDMSGLTSGDVLGFLMQLGVGNVQQGGTVYPDQSGGRAYTTVIIP